MEEEMWHINEGFTEGSPEEKLSYILEHDQTNYHAAHVELSEYIYLLDDAIALYISSLQIAYRHVDEWKDTPSMQASMAMAYSALNYLLLARHGILLGYYPEARSLLRGCYECVTRCWSFHADEKMARKFLAGENLKQIEVDKRIVNITKEKKETDENEAFKHLRNLYSLISNLMHPNLISLESRVESSKQTDFKIKVGTYPHIGGVLSPSLGKGAIATVLEFTMISLSFIRPVVRPMFNKEEAKTWEDDFEKFVYLKKYEKVKDEFRKLAKEASSFTL